ncbi:hypothetical protein BHE74_00029592 [Ensete ventricosum]|nr:hypothetical protein BHE74_00029592 [Ensete ventricosum]
MATAGQQQGQGAKRKPVFTKVDQLKPGTGGHTLVVKVVNSNTVVQKGRAASSHLGHTRVAECLVGDDTASIVFTARNEQGIIDPRPFLFHHRCRMLSRSGGLLIIALEWKGKHCSISYLNRFVIMLCARIMYTDPKLQIIFHFYCVNLLISVYPVPEAKMSTLVVPFDRLMLSMMNELSNLTVDLLKPGATVILRNAKIDMFKGCMRLAVDKWGRIEVAEPANFEVKEDNNLSMVEYELVNVGEE